MKAALAHEYLRRMLSALCSDLAQLTTSLIASIAQDPKLARLQPLSLALLDKVLELSNLIVSSSTADLIPVHGLRSEPKLWDEPPPSPPEQLPEENGAPEEGDL